MVAADEPNCLIGVRCRTAERKGEQGYCIERATQSDSIHIQMSKQVTSRVT